MELCSGHLVTSAFSSTPRSPLFRLSVLRLLVIYVKSAVRYPIHVAMLFVFTSPVIPKFIYRLLLLPTTSDLDEFYRYHTHTSRHIPKTLCAKISTHAKVRISAFHAIGI